MSGPETRMVNRIRKAIMAEWPTAVVYKMHGSEYMERGIPDLLCCIEGLFVAIEVKLRDSSHGVSPAQQAQLDRLHVGGAIAMVGYDPDEVIRRLRFVMSDTH